MQAQRRLRLIKNHVRGGGLRTGLAQRGDIVEHPKGAAMSCHHQIVIFHYEVVNGRDGEVQLERLPVRAVIERNENAELCARVKQPSFLRIFADRVHVRSIRNSVRNSSPCFPQIGSFENIRLEVVEFMSIYRDVSAVGVVRRRIDEIDGAPIRHFRRDV